MAYQRIQPFPGNAASLSSVELAALQQVWSEKRSELEATGVFQEFIKKMQREWAIETGIIERLYTWDRGVTEILIEQGIDAAVITHRAGLRSEQADNIKQIIDDQLMVVEGLFLFVKGDQPLTEHFIRGLQAQFTAHQDDTEAMTPDGQMVRIKLEKGKYKTQPNNPKRPEGDTHEYCPPEFTQEEMERLVEWYRAAENEFGTDVRASWLHHRFTQIHPFQDGNGRVARALASLVFLRNGLFPLVIRDSERRDYIAALEVADGGDLKPLVTLFAKRQRDAVLHALGLEQQVQQNRYADQIIASALAVLKDKYAAQAAKRDQVYEHAALLVTQVSERLQSIADTLDQELYAITPPGHSSYHARVSSADSESERKHYFYNQIIEIAKRFNYFANLEKYRAWLRLTIVTEETFEFVVSVHGYGHSDSGVVAISAFSAQRVPKEEGGTEVVNMRPASIDLFQLNYAEPLDNIKQRFSEWLESSLAIALAEWKRLISA